MSPGERYSSSETQSRLFRRNSLLGAIHETKFDFSNELECLLSFQDNHMMDVVHSPVFR